MVMKKPAVCLPQPTNRLSVLQTAQRAATTPCVILEKSVVVITAVAR